MSNHRVPSILLKNLTPGESAVNEVTKCTLQLPENIHQIQILLYDDFPKRM